MEANELIKELRLGNYIKLEKYLNDGDRVFKVEIFGVNNRISTSCINKDGEERFVFMKLPYEPIQLTEEILLKCGFEKIRTDYFIEGIRFYVSKPDNFDDFVLVDKDSVLTIVKHLHQLQNLYFSLTGEELKVNL